MWTKWRDHSTQTSLAALSHVTIIYLFSSIEQNEVWKFSWILTLSTFESGKDKSWLLMMTPRGISPDFFCWYLMKSCLTYILLWLPPGHKVIFWFQNHYHLIENVYCLTSFHSHLVATLLKGFYTSSYLQCTTSSESLFNSYNLMASFSSSWQDMVHGSPEMNQQANKQHFSICQSQSM